MNYKFIGIFVVILLVCGLTPGSAVSMGEAQKNMDTHFKEVNKNLNYYDMVNLLVKLPILIKTFENVSKQLETFNNTNLNNTDTHIQNLDVNTDAESLVNKLNTRYDVEGLFTCLHGVKISDLKENDLLQLKNHNGFIRYAQQGSFNENNGIFTGNIIRISKSGYLMNVNDLTDSILQLQEENLQQRENEAKLLIKKGESQLRTSWSDPIEYIKESIGITILEGIGGIAVLLVLSNFSAFLEFIKAIGLWALPYFWHIILIVCIICLLMEGYVRYYKYIGSKNVGMGLSQLENIKKDREDLSKYW